MALTDCANCNAAPENLADNIPGSILLCHNDKYYTTSYVNDGFLTLTGYTRKEFSSLFHNKFINMIHPDDRDSTLNTVAKLSRKNNTFETEYRVMHKNGNYLWVLDKTRLVKTTENTEILCCVLLDITSLKFAQKHLKLSLDRHKIIMDQTTDIIFEWNIETDELSFSSNFFKKFGYVPTSHHITERLLVSENIHPDDLKSFRQILESVKSGVPYSEAEFRIKKKSGEYIWCKIRATAQYAPNKIPIKSVGVIVDIDNEKKQSQTLLFKAERDALTGLYNKATAQSQIEARLASIQENSLSALFIVDVDNFKTINDSLGHLAGDAVLADISSSMQKLFRSSDVLGRVGGDEFVIFMTNLEKESLADKKAQQVLDSVSHIFDGEKKLCDISCSIGIAFSPNSGKEFLTLYQNADRALYAAKRQGKNTFVVYNSDLLTPQEISIAATDIPTAVNETIDSNEDNHVLNNKLVEYVFRMLYKSIDIETAVNLILEIVGRHFDVSRAYIFENSENDQYCFNTFEWCNDGILSQIDNFQNLSYKEDLGDYLKNFNENGIFYCRDIKTLHPDLLAILNAQGIESILQCAIQDNGRFKGLVGFDECRTNRFWTQEQIDVLSFISEILSSFLLKKRAQDRAELLASQMQTVLDNQNSWIYVVDKDTFKMLYINQKCLQLVPDAKLGTTCYKAFFNRDSVCERCPLKEALSTSKNCSQEIYNPLLKVWSLANASLVPWGIEKTAGLLSCHDITPYKKSAE